MDERETFFAVNELLEYLLLDAKESKEALLSIAGRNAKSMKIVTKAAIHYEYLGDNRKFDALKELILGLEEMERSNPSLCWEQNVASTLVMTLSGAFGKGTLTQQEIGMHEWRAHATIKILEEMIDKNAISVAGPLLAAVQDLSQREVALALLDKMEGKSFGKGNAECLRGLASICTPALRNPHERKYAVSLLGQIIDQNQNDLIYLVGPLLAAAQDPLRHGAVITLLDKMEGKTLGKGDAECLRRLASVSTAALTDTGRREHVVSLFGQIIDQNQNDLVYFVGPLLAATQNPSQKRAAFSLLDKMEGKPLGKGDTEAIKKLSRILRAAITTPAQGGYAKSFAKQLACEGVDVNLGYESPRWNPRRQPNSQLHSQGIKQRRRN